MRNTPALRLRGAMRLLCILFVLFAVLPAGSRTFAAGGDKIYKNDSIVGGGQGNVQAGFAKNEIAASVHRVLPTEGPVFLREIRVIIQNALGLTTPRKVSFLVYNSGTTNPGPPIFTSPIFTVGAGEVVYDVSGAGIEFASGQLFAIGVKFEDGGGLSSFTSVVSDTDGIVPARNLIYSISQPTGWNQATTLGVTGDFAIRAAVTTHGPVQYATGTPGTLGVPTIDTTGNWKVGNAQFKFGGTLGASQSTAFLGVAEAAGNFPVLGIVVWIDPFTMFTLEAPSDVAGTWVLPVPIPADPLLANRHFHAQVYFADPGAPQGLSASAALDITIAP